MKRSRDKDDYTQDNDTDRYASLSPEETFSIAMRLHGEGRYAEALKCINFHQEKNPHNIYGYYIKITILEHMNRWSDAKECFDQVWDPNTSDPNLILLRANQYAHLDDEKGAMDLVKKAEDAGAAPVELCYFKGEIARALSKGGSDAEMYDKAIYWMKEACSLDKKNAEYHATASAMLLVKFERDADGSMASAEHAAEATASTASAAEKALAESILYGKEAIRLGNSEYTTCYNVGRALGIDGKHEEAIGYFEMALRQDSDSSEAQAMIGMCMASQNSEPRDYYEKAIKYIEDAIDGDPDVTFATVARAGALLKLGRAHEVIFSLRTYLEHAPGDVMAWTILGHAYFSISSPKSARDCMKNARKIDPTLPSVNVLLREFAPPPARD